MNMKQFLRVLALTLTLLMALSAFALAESSGDIAAEPAEAEVSLEESLNLGALVDVQQKAYDDEEHDYEVKLNKSSVSQKAWIGDYITIDVGDYESIKWKSSDKKIAVVDDGEVECLKKGTVKITATFKNGKKSVTRTLTIKIADPYEPKSVSIVSNYDEDEDVVHYFDAKGKWNVSIGATGEMEAVVFPEDAPQDVTWKSSSKSIFKINEDGSFKAKKPGKATITATAENGKKQTLNVVVKKNKYAANYSKSDLKKLLKEAVEDEEIYLKVKSVEVESATKVTATFILFNGLNEKISKLKNVDISISAGTYEWDDDEADYDFDSDPDMITVASAEVSSIKVSCGKKATKEFKLTFTGEQIEDIDVKLGDKNVSVDCDYIFDHK